MPDMSADFSQYRPNVTTSGTAAQVEWSVSGPLPPEPGMIGLTVIGGRTEQLIQWGEWLNGEGFHRWTHAFVYLPGNNVLEAEPGGAVIRPMHYSPDNIYWCRRIYELLPAHTDADLLRTAVQFKGVPYSFADYGALAAHRLHIPAPFLKAYVASSKHLICSQLCDVYYQRRGANVFTDKRWPGYVTPASLYNRDLELE